jgi:hypothetical protein
MRVRWVTSVSPVPQERSAAESFLGDVPLKMRAAYNSASPDEVNAEPRKAGDLPSRLAGPSSR